jgi:hypothetical protein
VFSDCGSELKSRHRLLFRPFPELSIFSDKAVATASNHITAIEGMIADGHYPTAERDSKALAALALHGIDYYDTFDQTRLKWIVTTGYVSFALYTLVYITEKYGTNKDRRPGIPITSSQTLDMVMLTISASITALFAFERTPWYCLYAAFPLFYVRCLLQYLQHRYCTTQHQSPRYGIYNILMTLTQCVLAVGVLFYIAVSSSSIRSVSWKIDTGRRVDGIQCA